MAATSYAASMVAAPAPMAAVSNHFRSSDTDFLSNASRKSLIRSTKFCLSAATPPRLAAGTRTQSIEGPGALKTLTGDFYTCPVFKRES